MARVGISGYVAARLELQKKIALRYLCFRTNSNKKVAGYPACHPGKCAICPDCPLLVFAYGHAGSDGLPGAGTVRYAISNDISVKSIIPLLFTLASSGHGSATPPIVI